MGAALQQIARVDGKLNAYVHQAGALALARAERLDASGTAAERRRLHGVPFAIKDIFLTSDMPTTACSRAPIGTRMRDAAVVTKLLELGAVPTGKVATYEHATGGPSFDLPFPPARNPWDPARTTGGSSSGSAAAVAAGMCAFALGTDTGGSLRTPAAFCGVAGFRPSPGRLPLDGVLPLAPSFDTVGVMAPCVRDCATIMQALIADLRPDKGLSGLRIGVARSYGDDVKIAPPIEQAMHRAAAAIETAGAQVVPIELPPAWDFTVAFRVLMLAEAWLIHRENIHTRPHLYGTALRYRITPGRLVAPADIAAARALARRLRRALAKAFAGLDLILMPIAQSIAPRLADMRLRHNFSSPQLTAAFSVGGNPVAALPVSLCAEGMPVGLQIGGAPGRDQLVLEAACALEARLGFDSARQALQQRLDALPNVQSLDIAPAPEAGTQDLLREADALFTRLKARLAG